MLNPGSPLFVGRLWQVSCQLKHQAVVTQEDPIVSDADFPGSSMVFQSSPAAVERHTSGSAATASPTS